MSTKVSYLTSVDIVGEVFNIYLDRQNFHFIALSDEDSPEPNDMDDSGIVELNLGGWSSFESYEALIDSWTARIDRYNSLQEED